MKAPYFTAASLLSSVACASPVFIEGTHGIALRQVPGSYYPITGATGGVFARLEIRELERAGGEMWNLFLLALAEFQAMDQNAIDSYFQIAGVHGMPWTAWDGVSGRLEDDGEGGRKLPDMGYCPHGQVLFGTWHRPYLILFEQKLQSIAKSIADSFPTASRANYQDAATKLRLPFWDWAKALPNDQPVIPLAASNEKTQVTFPNGTAASIDNPLFDYNFHPLDNTQINGTGCPIGNGQAGRPQICQTYTQTIRGGSAEGGGDQANVNARLRSDLASQRTKLYAILSQYQTFTQITSSQGCGAVGRAGNLENIHNNIHIKFAPGHLMPTSVAAFDPLFWLHHANVDRQIALHQALYPNTYLEQCKADGATFTIGDGELLDAGSALTPFHTNSAGDFWTSLAARKIQDMGYTYPELANNPSNETLVASIKAQYSGPVNVSALAVSAKRAIKRQSSSSMEKTIYLAETKLPTYGLQDGKGSASAYSVLIFLGGVGTDASTWATSDSLVSTSGTLGGHMQSDQAAVSTIDLSRVLEKAIDSGQTTFEEAEQFLKKNLSWRIELGGIEIPKKAVPNIKVALLSTKVEVAQSDTEFDRWVDGFNELGAIDA